MAQDWLADVQTYDTDADAAVVGKIVRHCGIALRNPDSALVSFRDAKETDRVRANFLKKKLGLTQSDEALDAGIAAVAARMKGDRTKNRVTVYYLLADYFDALDVFGGAKHGVAGGRALAAVPVKKAAAPKRAAAKPAAAAAAANAPVKTAARKTATAPKVTTKPKAVEASAPEPVLAAPIESVAAPTPDVPPSPPPAAPLPEPAPLTAAGLGASAGPGPASTDHAPSGSRWWLWLLVAVVLIAVFLIWRSR